MALDRHTGFTLDPETHALIVNATDPENGARAGAASVVVHRVLAGSPSTASALVEHVLSRVTLGEPPVRRSALDLLSSFGPRAESAVLPLFEVLRLERDSVTRGDIRSALARIQPEHPYVSGALNQALRHGVTSEERRRAAVLAGETEGLRPGCLNALIETVVESGEPALRAVAVRSLEAVVKRAEEGTVPWSASLAGALLEMSAIPSTPGAETAALVLGRIPSALGLVAEEDLLVQRLLATVLSASTLADRLAALSSLDAYPQSYRRTVPVLLNCLAEATGELAEGVISALLSLLPSMPREAQWPVAESLAARLGARGGDWAWPLRCQVARSGMACWHDRMAMIVEDWAIVDYAVALSAIRSVRPESARRIFRVWSASGQSDLVAMLEAVAERDGDALQAADLLPFLSAEGDDLRVAALGLLSRVVPEPEPPVA